MGRPGDRPARKPARPSGADLSARIPEPSDPMFGSPPLPAKFEAFRPQQWQVVQEAMEAFRAKSTVLIQAPPGTGKTLIAETIRRLLGAPSVYMATTKQLQDQVARDFPWAKVLKGRGNYLTELGKLDAFGNPAPRLPYSEITCADCTLGSDQPCRWCPSGATGCPYTIATRNAQYAPLVITNTAYFLSDVNLGRGRLKGRDLAIIDEGDLLEREILSRVTVEISPSRMEKMKLSPPKRKTEKAISNDWLDWVKREALPKAYAYGDTLTPPWFPNTTKHQIQEYKTMNNLILSLEMLERELPEKGWVLDGLEENRVRFRPILVTRQGSQMVWPHARRFLLMSGTFLSAPLTAEELGLAGQRRYTMIDVPSVVPADQRPIIIPVPPVAEMKFSNKPETYPRMRDAIYRVLARHPDNRVLVHTHTYELARFLHRELGAGLSGDVDRPLYVYTASREKEEALRNYRRSQRSVLFAPSLDRGTDLPGDDCRVQIIAKIPWPNKGDVQISGRMQTKGGTAWYKRETIKAIIQMSGRAVRSESDWAYTYILDDQFRLNVLGAKHLFPKWWLESLRQEKV